MLCHCWGDRGSGISLHSKECCSTLLYSVSCILVLPAKTLEMVSWALSSEMYSSMLLLPCLSFRCPPQRTPVVADITTCLVRRKRINSSRERDSSRNCAKSSTCITGACMRMIVCMYLSMYVYRGTNDCRTCDRHAMSVEYMCMRHTSMTVKEC